MQPPDRCPRCGGHSFTERDCGLDNEDSPGWTAWVCTACGLWYSGWFGRWLVDVAWWQDEEDAAEYQAAEGSHE